MTKVVILSPYPERLSSSLEGVEIIEPDGDHIPNADFLISFGWRKIIPPGVLARFPRRAINIHIGYLPWNRGADPNFWSWFDNTKKGITIHDIDANIDTGDIIFQSEILKFWNKNPTLKTTYNELMASACLGLSWCWPAIKAETIPRTKQSIQGTFHRASDKEPWMRQLQLGWDTPVAAVEELGRCARGEINGKTG